MNCPYPSASREPLLGSSPPQAQTATAPGHVSSNELTRASGGSGLPAPMHYYLEPDWSYAPARDPNVPGPAFDEDAIPLVAPARKSPTPGAAAATTHRAEETLPLRPRPSAQDVRRSQTTRASPGPAATRPHRREHSMDDHLAQCLPRSATTPATSLPAHELSSVCMCPWMRERRAPSPESGAPVMERRMGPTQVPEVEAPVESVAGGTDRSSTESDGDSCPALSSGESAVDDEDEAERMMPGLETTEGEDRVQIWDPEVNGF